MEVLTSNGEGLCVKLKLLRGERPRHKRQVRLARLIFSQVIPEVTEGIGDKVTGTVRELLPTDLCKRFASNCSTTLLNVQGMSRGAGVTQRGVEVDVDPTRESDRRLDRGRGSSHVLRPGLLLLVIRSIKHARPDRRGGKLTWGHTVRAIKHWQGRERALIKTHVHPSHNAILVWEIAEVAGTARAIADENCGLTSTVVMGIDAEAFLNERVARATESAKVRNIRLTTERDRGHKLVQCYAITSSRTVVDIARRQ